MLRNFIKPCFFCHSARVKMSLSSVLFSRGHSWCSGLGKHEFILLCYLPRSITCIERAPSPKLCLSPQGGGAQGVWQKAVLSPQSVTLYCFKVVLLTFLYFFFFWLRKIAFKMFCWFRRTAMWISYKYTHISPLSWAPLPGPSCPSRSSQSARLGSVCYTAASHLFLCFARGVHLCWCSFLHSSWPLLLKFLSLFYLPLDRELYWRGGSRAVRVKKKRKKKSFFFQIVELEGTKIFSRN